MYFDLEKLSKNEFTRDLQLRVLMSIQTISDLVIDVPNLIDIVRLEKRLIDDYYFLLENIFNPNEK